MPNDLESRVADLERKTKSLRRTFLFVVLGLLALVLMQYKINLSLKDQIHRTEVPSHAE